MTNDDPGAPRDGDHEHAASAPAGGVSDGERPPDPGPAPDPWSRQGAQPGWQEQRYRYDQRYPQDQQPWWEPHPPPHGVPYPGPGGPPPPPYAGGPSWAGPQHAEPAAHPRRRGVASILAFALGAALVGGGVGGFVGYELADDAGAVGGLGEPPPDGEDGPPEPVEAVAARVLPSVVQLRVEGTDRIGEGSGMVLGPDGLILTNNHVVEPAASGASIVAVFRDGATAPARIVGRDPNSDLAVIRAEGVSGLTPIELGDSEAVRVGQQVVAFGSPLGLGGTVTTGIISAVDRAVSVGEDTGASAATVLNALQTDAAINPGNSGGPLVDMQGRVVGINSAIATTGARGGSIGVGFAIPVNQARRVAQELERTGQASKAVLGVTVSDAPQRPGAVIQSVVPGGAAAAAGLRAGDVVLRFGDQRIATGVDLQAAVGSRAPGEVVEIELGDRTVQVTLKPAEG